MRTRGKRLLAAALAAVTMMASLPVTGSLAYAADLETAALETEQAAAEVSIETETAEPQQGGADAESGSEDQSGEAAEPETAQPQETETESGTDGQDLPPETEMDPAENGGGGGKMACPRRQLRVNRRAKPRQRQSWRQK